MTDKIDRPVIRPTLALTPVGQGADMRVLMHDPQGFSRTEFVITPQLFFMASLFNGANTVVEIQTQCSRRLGYALRKKQVEDAIARFDEALFLESDRFFKEVEKQETAFKALETRPAAHAGRSYPDDPETLRRHVGNFFTSPGGPGEIGEKNAKTCLGIVAPHIDFTRGGTASAFAFKALAESAHHDTILVLGVNHGPSTNLYPATPKDFNTPLGVVETDREFVRAMADAYQGDLFADELAHRNEHSVELQAVFLAYACPGVKIVPVLASGFHEFLARGVKPSEFELIDSFINAVKTAREKTGRGVTLLAGVDFAHMGARFGQPPVTDEIIEKTRAADEEMIKTIESGDAEAFNENVLRDSDARNVCGYPALYTFLRILGGAGGELLKYDQAVEPETRSMVSFASMAFYEQ